MPRGTWDGSAPISAARCVALGSRLGADDYFSSDLTDAEMADRLGHLDRPTLIALGAEDEYIPANVDKQRLGARWAGVVRRRAPCSFVLLDRAKHYLDSNTSPPFLQATTAFLAE